MERATSSLRFGTRLTLETALGALQAKGGTRARQRCLTLETAPGTLPTPWDDFCLPSFTWNLRGVAPCLFCNGCNCLTRLTTGRRGFALGPTLGALCSYLLPEVPPGDQKKTFYGALLTDFWETLLQPGEGLRCYSRWRRKHCKGGC